jgi:hypothetical protein
MQGMIALDGHKLTKIDFQSKLPSFNKGVNFHVYLGQGNTVVVDQLLHIKHYLGTCIQNIKAYLSQPITEDCFQYKQVTSA